MNMLHREQSSLAPNHYLIDMIGLIAQQGTTQTAVNVSLRLLLYAVLMMNFLLYNYYTASIVGELLSGSNQGPSTIEQLAKSSLAMVFNNDSYNRALTMDNASLAKLQKLYPGQVFATAANEATTFAPIYADVDTAVRLLKQGGFAFHCELSEAFRAIANHFDADEVCDLRTVNLSPDSSYRITCTDRFVPKRLIHPVCFPYGRVLLTKATELGLVRRLLKTYWNGMPDCQAGPSMHPVVLSGASAPFVILAGKD
uniref:Ionotropic glutamate receptor C-terminal domain-containing protein n=1 Tax=Anopheles farauti TaxID=69004 RepID=A0A182QCD1_9DIPT